MQFLSDLKKAAKGQREEEFSFDDDVDKGKAGKWLDKINGYSKKIQAAPAAAKEKLQKMREPKDEEKAAYFEEAAQEKAKSANWWSGCDPKEDPDVKQWSRSASSETVQSHAAGESLTSGDESWHDEEESEDEAEAEQKNQVRMSQIDFESLQNGGPAIKPMETITEAAEPEPKESEPKAQLPSVSAKAATAVEAKDPFDSSGDEDKDPKPAPAPAKVEEPRKGPKKGKKPAKAKPAAAAPAAPAPAKDPFADSDSDGGGTKSSKAPAASAAAVDPFADSDTETGPLLPSTPVEATMRPSQVPQRKSETSKSSSGGNDAPKKVKKPKGRPDKEDGTASSSSKKPVGRPKKKAPQVAPAAAAQDSDGEDAKF